MTLLQRTRDGFLATTQSYVDREALKSIEAVLDRLIDWTQREFPGAVPAEAGDQATVAFTFGSDGQVFWRAYPRRQDGAKVVVLSGLADAMAPEARAALIEVLGFVDGMPRVPPGGALQISMMDLGHPESLERFLLFLKAAGSAALTYLDKRSSH
jgi:hypothetical protein